MTARASRPQDHDPESSKTEDRHVDRNLVGSVLHGLTILDMFGRDRKTIAIGEMASHLGLHKSSASRLAATLASAGYLDPAESPGLYRLGSRLAAVGQLAAADLDIERVVMPHLAHLTWVTGETGHLAALDGADARTLAITDGWHTVRMHSWAGKTSPAFCSSMLAGVSEAGIRSLYPKAELPAITERSVSTVNGLLEDLAGLRATGFGFDDEELETGLRCISAPIVGPKGTIVASISISGPTQRLNHEAVEKAADHVRWAAAQASAALGASPTTPDGWAAAPDAEPEPLDWVEAVRPARLHEQDS
jgi:DNA-binding IclR family transcriptional regulator